MSSGEDSRIFQPAQILAAGLDATVHSLPADHQLVPSSAHVVSADSPPGRHLSPRFGEQVRIAIDNQPALRHREPAGKVTDVGGRAGPEIEDAQRIVTAD